MKGGGGGPTDGMLDRVERLETILASLEPKINEILLTGARQVDLQRLETKVAEIVASGAKQADVHRLELRLSESAKQVDLKALRTDLAEVKGRVSMLPTWWMLITALIATWGAGTAIVFALLRFAPK